MDLEHWQVHKIYHPTKALLVRWVFFWRGLGKTKTQNIFKKTLPCEIKIRLQGKIGKNVELQDQICFLTESQCLAIWLTLTNVVFITNSVLPCFAYILYKKCSITFQKIAITRMLSQRWSHMCDYHFYWWRKTNQTLHLITYNKTCHLFLLIRIS
jgi:hypothetical protein